MVWDDYIIWNKSCWKWFKLLFHFFFNMKNEAVMDGPKTLSLSNFTNNIKNTCFWPYLLHFSDDKKKIKKNLTVTWTISNNFCFIFLFVLVLILLMTRIFKCRRWNNHHRTILVFFYSIIRTDRPLNRAQLFERRTKGYMGQAIADPFNFDIFCVIYVHVN